MIKMSKVGSKYICLVLIVTDFPLKNDESYYPQLKKKTKLNRYISNDLEIFSDDSDKENSDKED